MALYIMADIQLVNLLITIIRNDFSKDSFLEKLNTMTTQNWNFLLQIAKQNSVLPIMVSKIVDANFKLSLSPDVLEILKFEQRSSNLKFIKQKAVYDKISELLINNNIKFIPLKGIYLSNSIYGNGAFRPMVDIDILVQNKNVDKALHSIYELGGRIVYNAESQFINNIRQHTYPIIYNGVAIEIHRNIVTKYDKVKITEQDLWQDTIENSKGVRYLSPEWMLFHLCYHVYRAMQGGIAKIIWFLDIHLFVKVHNADINWEKFIAVIKKVNAEAEVFFSLGISKFLFYSNDLARFDTQLKEYCKTPEDIFDFFLHPSLDMYKPHYFSNFKNIHGMQNKLLFTIYKLFPNRLYLEYTYQSKNIFILRSKHLIFKIMLLPNLLHSIFHYIFIMKSGKRKNKTIPDFKRPKPLQ